MAHTTSYAPSPNCHSMTLFLNNKGEEEEEEEKKSIFIFISYLMFVCLLARGREKILEDLFTVLWCSVKKDARL